jgi:putative chitinase
MKEALKALARLPDEKLEEYAPLIIAACEEFEVNTPKRVAAFLAQWAHETQGFTRFVENLNYSAKGLLSTFPRHFTPEQAEDYARQPEKIANRVYANRMGNGPEASGDGWRYRGRGAPMLTGRENYRVFGRKLGLDLEANPDRAAEPGIGFRLAGLFWRDRNLNELADRGDFKLMTRRINGGLIGLEDRLALYHKAQEALA